MKNRTVLKTLSALLIFAVSFYFIRQGGSKVSPFTKNIEEKNILRKSIINQNTLALKSTILKKQKVDNSATFSDTPISLNLENFESLVSRCFEGEKCSLKDNPWELYQTLKMHQKNLAIDHLISFMRSKIQDSKPKPNDHYRAILKKMIIDFYPPEERMFQQASYYYYTGNLEKSLALYLDLENRARIDSTLRPAPKLNIANTLYEMGRFAEANTYYREAFQEYTTGSQYSEPGRIDTIEFIERRLNE